MNHIRRLISFPWNDDNRNEDRGTFTKRNDANRSNQFIPPVKPYDNQTEKIYSRNHPHVSDDDENEDDIFGSNNEDDEDFDLFDSRRKSYAIQEIKQKHPQNHNNNNHGVTNREMELKRKQSQQPWPQHYHGVTPKSNESPSSISAPAGVSIHNSGFQKTKGFVNLSGYTGGDGVRHMLVAEKIEAVYFVNDRFGGMRAITSP